MDPDDAAEPNDGNPAFADGSADGLVINAQQSREFSDG